MLMSRTEVMLLLLLLLKLLLVVVMVVLPGPAWPCLVDIEG